MEESTQPEARMVRRLTVRQRRILGVLVEKALTTPEGYPLTLKSLTAGCNQKSNRSPTVAYSDDDVLDTLEELRALGLAAEVHTESGRTSRYRHYVRRSFTFSEPQIAIMAELWLRGRQQPGELRTRAGRMVAIPNQESLRLELGGLLEDGFIQASGPLGQRGIEVDHTFYADTERRAPLSKAAPGTRLPESFEISDAPSSRATASAMTESQQTEFARHERELASLRAELTKVTARVDEAERLIADLRSQLGC